MILRKSHELVSEAIGRIRENPGLRESIIEEVATKVQELITSLEPSYVPVRKKIPDSGGMPPG